MDNLSKIDFFSKYNWCKYQGAMEYKSNIVGQGFQTTLIDDGNFIWVILDHICVSIVGEIVEAEDFEGDNL